jgi:hypothetical protein
VALKLHATRERVIGGLVVALILAAAVAYFTFLATGNSAPKPSIADYCAYGAVSQAQLSRCETHAKPDEIARLHTNAADFAMRRLRSCRPDAGPFCRLQLASDNQAAQGP